MQNKLEQLKGKIDEIESLKAFSPWGVEYQLWKDITDKLVKDTFGERGFKLFQQQGSVVLSDDAYITELESRKKVLEGLFGNREEYLLESQQEKVMPTAIKVNGKLVNSQIIGNKLSRGVRLLEADGIESSLIKKNKTIENWPKESFWSKFFWQIIVTIIVGIIIIVGAALILRTIFHI